MKRKASEKKSKINNEELSKAAGGHKSKGSTTGSNLGYSILNIPFISESIVKKSFKS